MGNSISICLITKNEENNLKKCFSSIKGISDEIIVVDTGSSDNTVLLAKDLGAKVYNYVWENDFSKARNFALDKCSMEWIFVIDADETLEEGHGLILKKLLSNTSKEAIYMNLKNIIGTTVINENPTIRIFRNRPEYRYENKIHEQVVNSILKKGQEDVFENTNLILNHYGYDHNVVDMNKKIKRNVKILESYDESEKDGIYYFGLGNEYMKLNDYINAKDCLIKAINYTEKDQGVKTYSVACIIQTFYQLGEYNTGIKYANKFLKSYPDFRDLYFLKAVCNNSIMKYSESYIALSIFKALPEKIDKYPSFKFESNNNIDGLLFELQKYRVTKKPNLLTTIIEINNINSKYKDCILNINEISDEVIALNKTDNLAINKEIEELGAIVHNEEFSLNNYIFKGQWTLKLNENNIFDFKDRIEIINKITQLEKAGLTFSKDKYNLNKNSK